MERALSATRKRHAHRLPNPPATNIHDGRHAGSGKNMNKNFLPLRATEDAVSFSTFSNHLVR
jgi:hypothetical protein